MITEDELNDLRQNAARYLYLKEFCAATRGVNGWLSFAFKKKAGLDAAVDRSMGNVDGPGFEEQNTARNIFLDATRYRWLRDISRSSFPFTPYALHEGTPDDLDDQIDARLIAELDRAKASSASSAGGEGG